MNMTPMCDYKIPDFREWMGERDCDLRAEWVVFNKSDSTRLLRCNQHVFHSIEAGSTTVISPARSLAKRDGKGFTVGEAQRMGVCRICGESRDMKKGDVGFILGFGYEHAHASCMDDEAHNHLDRVLSKRGPFRGD